MYKKAKLFLIILLLILMPFYATIAFSQPLFPRFAYVPNNLDNSLSIYSIDNDSGLLHHIGYVPTPMSPSAAILHPSGKFLYVCSQTIDTISIFKVNPVSGRLTEISASPVKSVVRSPFSLSVSPDGKFLYVPGRFTANVQVFLINKETGALKAVSSIKTGGERVRFARAHPSGKFVFATSAFSDFISVFDVKHTGKLSSIPHSPFATKQGPQDIVIDQSGRFIYVPNWISGNVSSYKLNQNTGTLSETKNSPAPAGTYPFQGAVHASGKFLYVTNHWSADISGYRINQLDGSLTQLSQSPFKDLDLTPGGIAITKDGRFAYVNNLQTSSISIFNINGDTGDLTAINKVMTRSGPRKAVILSGDHPFKSLPGLALVTISSPSSKTSNVLTYNVSPDSGELSSTGNFKVNGNLVPVAVSPTDNLVFTADSESHSVSVLQLNPDTGQLQLISKSAFKLPATPLKLFVDHNGHYLYILTANPNAYVVFKIYKDGGLEGVEGVWLSKDAHPNNLLIEPTDRFAMVIDSKGNGIDAFRFKIQKDRILTDKMTRFGSPNPTGHNPQALAVGPTGRFAYVANTDSGNVSGYAIPTNADSLKQMTSSPFPAGKSPIAVAADPKGKFLYVLNQGESSISLFSIDSYDGSLKEIKPRFSVDDKSTGLVIDPSGNFAYVTSRDDGTISRFAIDSKTGMLTKQKTIFIGKGIIDLSFTTKYE